MKVSESLPAVESQVNLEKEEEASTSCCGCLRVFSLMFSSRESNRELSPEKRAEISEILGRQITEIEKK